MSQNKRKGREAQSRRREVALFQRLRDHRELLEDHSDLMDRMKLERNELYKKEFLKSNKALATRRFNLEREIKALQKRLGLPVASFGQQ